MNEYRLDYSYTLYGTKYNLKDCTGFNSYYSKRHSLLNGIYEFYRENKKEDFQKYVDENDYSQVEITYRDETGKDLEVAKKMVQSLNTNVKELEGTYSNSHYNSKSIYNFVVGQATKRTPEYIDAENKFQEWLKTRSGVKNSWNEYVSSLKNNTSLTKDLDLEILSSHFHSAKFRVTVEHSRPDKFHAGQIVRMVDKYRNKRGTDPFYYNYEPELRSAERIGTVLKKEDKYKNHNYGVGSRAIRVLWFATGEESHVPEMSLRTHEVE